MGLMMLQRTTTPPAYRPPTTEILPCKIENAVPRGCHISERRTPPSKAEPCVSCFGACTYSSIRWTYQHVNLCRELEDKPERVKLEM